MFLLRRLPFACTNFSLLILVARAFFAPQEVAYFVLFCLPVCLVVDPTLITIVEFLALHAILSNVGFNAEQFSLNFRFSFLFSISGF